MAETHHRYADMEWCFNQLAQIDAASTMSRIYRAYALLSAQRATEAVDTANSIPDEDCNIHELVQKQLLLAKAGMMLGDYDMATSEMYKLLDLNEDVVIDENDSFYQRLVQEMERIM